MLPVLLKLAADTPLSMWLMYALALALAAYAGWSGYQGALGPLDPKTQKFAPPQQKDRWQRAAIFGVVGAGIARVGLYFALPSRMFLGGRGEGIPIHTYGVMLGTGFLTAVWLASRLALREWPGKEGEKKKEQIYDLAFWVFLAGIGGAMLLFRLVNLSESQPLSFYLANPARLVDCVTGGMVFYGGLIGAALAAYFWARAHQINFLRLADLAIPTVSLGQAFGRLGCFSAGCCWGDVAPAHFPLGIHFPGPGLVKGLFGGQGPASSLAYQSQATDPKWVVEETGQIFDHMVPGAVRISEWVTQHGHTLPVYPTQMLESVGQFTIMLVLLALRSQRRFHGQIFAFWLMAYAVLRSTIELFRGDFERGTLHGLFQTRGWSALAEAFPLTAWYNLSTSQIISLCMFAFGATLLFRNRARFGGFPSATGPAPQVHPAG